MAQGLLRCTTRMSQMRTPRSLRLVDLPLCSSTRTSILRTSLRHLKWTPDIGQFLKMSTDASWTCTCKEEETVQYPGSTSNQHMKTFCPFLERTLPTGRVNCECAPTAQSKRPMPIPERYLVSKIHSRERKRSDSNIESTPEKSVDLGR